MNIAEDLNNSIKMNSINYINDKKRYQCPNGMKLPHNLLESVSIMQSPCWHFSGQGIVLAIPTSFPSNMGQGTQGKTVGANFYLIYCVLIHAFHNDSNVK